MRVTLLSTFGETCGIATYSEALLGALPEHGIEPVVISPRLRPGDVPRGSQPLRVWRRDRATLLQAVQTFRELRSKGTQVVHVQVSLGLASPRFLFTLSQLCAGAKLPLVATLHDRMGGGRLRRWRFERTLLALGAADLIVHEADQRLELQRDRVHVIPHGTWGIARRAPEQARRELGVSPSAKVVTHFGFLHPDKGIEDVVGAVAELRARGFKEVEYRVCGGTFPCSRISRDYLALLRARVSDLGLEHVVHLTGDFVSEERVTLELQAADLVVLNYRTGNCQGSSGAARRALAAGRPLLVSQAPIFDDMRSAVHTLRGPIASEIQRLLDRPAQREEIAARGGAFCETRGWELVGQLHAELYRALATRSAESTVWLNRTA